MTQNQIAYWQNVEMHRANLARERENTRTNVANEEIKRFANFENQRHNIAMESFNRSSLAETKRHNVKGEFNTAFANTETARHNRITEKQSGKMLKESIRHNKVAERQNLKSINEGIRHNKANERYQTATLPIQWANAHAAQLGASASMTTAGANVTNASANLQNAQTNAFNAQTNRYNADTTYGKAYADVILRSGDKFGSIPLVGNFLNAGSGAAATAVFSNKAGKSRKDQDIRKLGSTAVNRVNTMQASKSRVEKASRRRR